jgi:hypothetical protein
VRDADGYLWRQTGDPRASEDVVIPELQSQKMAPGNRISGTIYFVVPTDRALSGVFYQPTGNRLIQLADLSAAGAQRKPSQQAGGTPAASAVAVGGDCAGIEAWLEATVTRVERASAMSRADAQLDDPQALADHAAEYADLARAQQGETVPPAAAVVNRALVATLNAYAGALKQILAADEPGKDPALELAEAANTFNDAGTRLGQIQTKLTSLAAECGLS